MHWPAWYYEHLFVLPNGNRMYLEVIDIIPYFADDWNGDNSVDLSELGDPGRRRVGKGKGSGKPAEQGDSEPPPLIAEADAPSP